MGILSIDHVVLDLLGYQMSFVELAAFITGLISVYLAIKVNIHTWTTGFINVSLLFLLFYQTRLYADMMLQVFFMGASVYGWIRWKRAVVDDRVLWIGPRHSVLWLMGIICSAFAVSLFVGGFHVWWPGLFAPVEYAGMDSLVMVVSISATILLARKKVESWILWILVDIICIWLFAVKELYLLTLEYTLFLGLAVQGFAIWQRKAARSMKAITT
jgi:nicotinamide mononucleotide transporter